MDTLPGAFPGQNSSHDDALDLEHNEDGPGREIPPAAIGQDERRMQVRAYNFWASLLDNRNFPSIEDLEPDNLPDFGPYSVLLDFSTGIENPAIQFLGGELATECGAEGAIRYLADVPSRSLLSRITDHYMQIIANQAPIGFEAEFVNQRGATILYRGILLPFSSDDDTIDFIYGVINWKEFADQQTTDELLLEIEQALEPAAKPELDDAPMAEWADGPAETSDTVDLAPPADAAPAEADDWPVPGFARDDDRVADAEVFGVNDGIELTADGVATGAAAPDGGEEDRLEFPPDLLSHLGGSKAWATAPEWDDEDDDVFEFPEDMSLLEGGPGASAKAPELHDEGDDEFELSSDMVLPDTDDTLRIAGPIAPEPIAPEPLASEAADSAEPGLAGVEPASGDMGLADWLAEARELAMSAAITEDRSRQSLYAAIGRAYDFWLAAIKAPEDLAELIADAGLAMQDRAPLTPVVKLVFGADHDKTRIAEYASALGHAHRAGLGQGALAGYLGSLPGGLKALVAEERRLRREEGGAPAPVRDTPRPGILRKLRKLEHCPIAETPAQGSEFALLVARRLPTGEVVLVGEVTGDVALFEKAARKLIG